VPEARPEARPQARVIPLEKAKVIPLPLEAIKAQPPPAGSGKVIALDKSKEIAGTQRCPRCGTENPLDFRYCSECGLAFRQPVPQPMATTTPLPIAPGRANVRVLRGEKLGQIFPLGDQATAGRGTCTLSFPSDPFLAGLHCTLYFQGGRLFVRDEGSPSGTFVRLRNEEPLAPGDYFAVGDHLLRYAGSLPPPATAPDGTRLHGSPRPPGGAVKIEELHQGLVPGRASVRLGPTLSVGRDEGCDLSFAGDSYVSSRHCSITVAPGGRASLRDLGSTNGTFRRVAPRSERELVNGDCLRIGAQVLQIFETR
jgi:pSer/pThr/pTyr-binding forkhead associated (FHA) protein